MPGKDIHKKAFNDGTIAKLEMFEDFAKEWLPTFVMSGGNEIIHIFDFFSGIGYDVDDKPGSPIRILNVIKGQFPNIVKRGKKIFLHLNEYQPNRKDQSKFETLKKNCDEYLEQNNHLSKILDIKYYNKDASELFFELKGEIEKYPSLVFMDQNGVKFLEDKYFLSFSMMEKTDFLFFSSSSYFKRFGKSSEYSNYLNIDTNELEKTRNNDMHRLILKELRLKVPPESNLMLFPFSIKKKSNVYGIIFGTRHYRGVDKFLRASWNKNKLNGEANFDLDDDKRRNQLTFGFEKPLISKIDKFKQDLKDKILSGDISNNKEALKYTYDTGNDNRKAKQLISSMKKDDLITYEGSTPGVTYELGYSHTEQRTINYKVL
jgi:three-Cys-motif partner protein